MIALFQTFISFFAVIILSAFAAKKTGMNAGFAPLPTMSAIMIFCVLLGYFGFLPIAVWIVLLSAVLALFYLIITAKKDGFNFLLQPGFMLFCFAGAVFLVYLFIRRPVAQEWDEFSMWATSAKMTKMGDAIFSSVQSGFPWPTTQKPGLPTLSYFFNFFGEFEEWRMYAAYDILIVSVWSAAISGLKRKHWHIAVPTSILMFLLQYFHVYTRNIYSDFTYISSYADYPMALLCAGMLIWYYNAARCYKLKESTLSFCKRMILPLFLISGAIALCKDTGLALAFIASVIIAADLLFVTDKNSEFYVKLFSLKNILPKFAVIFAMFFGAIFVFVSSSIYLSSLGNSQGSVGGSSDLGYVSMLIEGTKQLLGLNAGPAGEPFVETFQIVQGQMIAYLFPAAEGLPSNSITMIGPGIMVFLLIMAICLSIALLCKDKLMRKSAISYAVFSTLGFLAYYIFIGFTYVYVFKAGITDYNRYVNTYYMMWLGGALILFAIAAVQGSKIKNSLTLGVFVLTFGFLFRYNQLVQPQLSLVSYPDAVYFEVNEIYDTADLIQEYVEPGANIFYVNNGDNGLNWFRYHYALMPENILMYSNGGGMFADPRYFESLDANAYYANQLYVMTREEFAAYLALYECEYVFIELGHSEFYQGYRALFSDGGDASYTNRTLLYKVNITGEPVYEELTSEDVNYAWELTENGEVDVNKNYDTRMKMVNALDCVSLTPVEMEMP